MIRSGDIKETADSLKIKESKYEKEINEAKTLPFIDKCIECDKVEDLIK
jgi:hypothetical protein